ncbi:MULTISPECIES: F0F1 ATP synthase subunit A [Amycolatopsis]|nr:F0F1 ATP synthase subunit A [Amycolatopsis sacchari]
MRISLRAGTFEAPGAGDFALPPFFGPVTKPMVLVVLSVVIIAGFFLLATRRPRLVPGRLQFAAEWVYDLARERIARDQIGSADFRPFVPLILALFTFVLVNDIFGLIPLVQFPTMGRIGFPVALAVFVVFPLCQVVGIRRHGLRGYLKNQLFPAGVPKAVYPLLTPIEAFLRFFMDPLTLAIRVFAAMFAGHLLLLAFTLGGEFLLLHGNGLGKAVSVVAFAFAVLTTFLEALVQVVQAYIFAALSAIYIGRALAAH